MFVAEVKDGAEAVFTTKDAGGRPIPTLLPVVSMVWYVAREEEARKDPVLVTTLSPGEQLHQLPEQEGQQQRQHLIHLKKYAAWTDLQRQYLEEKMQEENFPSWLL